MNAGGKRITDLADGFICLKLQLALSLGLFQFIFKGQTGCGFAFFLIEDTLFFENFMRRQLLTGGIQTLVCLFCFALQFLNSWRRRLCIRLWGICSGFSRFGQHIIGICILNCRRFPELVGDNRFGNYRTGMGSAAVWL